MTDLEKIRDDFPLVAEMVEYFFSQNLSDDREDPETLDIAIKMFLEHTSPDFAKLRDEIERYISLYNDNIETVFRQQFPNAFEPNDFGLTAKSFLQKIICSIDSLPDDYFPFINNMIAAGLHQDIHYYGNTLEEWMDEYWDQFEKRNFVKLKSEIAKYIRYHGTNIDNAYYQKYPNDFDPAGQLGGITVGDFFNKVCALIDARLKLLEARDHH